MARSYLFIPGNTPSMLQHANVFDSDAVIIDLEDSVSLQKKHEARRLVFEYLTKYYDSSIEIYIRINDPSTPFFEADVALLDGLPINGYVLPKATKDTVLLLSRMTKKPLIAIIESAYSVVTLEDIAKIESIKGLLLGAEDYTTDMNIERTIDGEELIYVRSRLAIYAKAYNKEAIDTPFTMKDDEEGLKKDILRAKALGLHSKSVIHPNHVTLVNQLMSPSESLVLWATRVLKKKAMTSKGAFSLDGKMVDEPIIKKAQKIIDEVKKYS
ncbi:MAG: HpcH/HpaI aldolase/citrate lyase family protein [Candidatus Izemoplasmataceae bacterium]